MSDEPKRGVDVLKEIHDLEVLSLPPLPSIYSEPAAPPRKLGHYDYDDLRDDAKIDTLEEILEQVQAERDKLLQQRAQNLEIKKLFNEQLQEQKLKVAILTEALHAIRQYEDRNIEIIIDAALAKATLKWRS